MNWISLSKKKPKKGVRVLVLLEHRGCYALDQVYIAVAKYSRPKKKTEFTKHVCGPYCLGTCTFSPQCVPGRCDVYLWMPLPESNRQKPVDTVHEDDKINNLITMDKFD